MIRLWIRGIWERRGCGARSLRLLLLPASWLYRFFAQIRNALFSGGWLRVLALDRPVISIGNLTVGGTGKTPSCLWLAQELGGRGYSVAILSRGYRRESSEPLVLQPGAYDPKSNEPAIAGDEPAMMARLYGQTVGIGSHRYGTGSKLLSKQNVDVFILDDGFQHRRLKRDGDLLLLGQDWSGRILPAGPFREPRKSLRRADFYLLTGAEDKWKTLIPPDRQQRCFSGSLKAVGLVGFGASHWKEFPLSLIYRSKILTVTGIADPRGFYSMIHEWEGDIIETLEFPDHHHYSARDWQQISRMGRLADLVVTTEKDILKLVRFPFAKDKLMALRVAMVIENGNALVDALVDKISRYPAGTAAVL